MRSIALFLLLGNLAAFYYWQFYAPPQAEKTSVAKLPKGVPQLALLSEQTPAALLQTSPATQTASITPAEAEVIAVAMKGATEPPAISKTVAPPFVNEDGTEQPLVTDLAEAPTEAGENKIQAGTVSGDELTTTIIAQAATPSMPIPQPKTVSEQQGSRQKDPAFVQKLSNLPDNMGQAFSDLRQFRIKPEAKAKPVTDTSSGANQASAAPAFMKLPAALSGSPAVLSSTPQAKNAMQAMTTPPPQLGPFATSTAVTTQTLAKLPMALPQATPPLVIPKTASAQKSEKKPEKKTSTAKSVSAKKIPRKKHKKSSKQLCYRTGTYSKRQSAEHAQRWFQKKGMRSKLKIQGKPKLTTSKVYLPAYQTRAVAQYMVQQLTQRGIRDYQLNADNSISLGVFRDADGAQRRMVQLHHLGFHEVKILRRYQGARQYWLYLKIPENRTGILKSFVNAFKVLRPKRISCKG